MPRAPRQVSGTSSAPCVRACLLARGAACAVRACLPGTHPRASWQVALAAAKFAGLWSLGSTLGSSARILRRSLSASPPPAQVLRAGVLIGSNGCSAALAASGRPHLPSLVACDLVRVAVLLRIVRASTVAAAKLSLHSQPRTQREHPHRIVPRTVQHSLRHREGASARVRPGGGLRGGK